MRRSATDAVGKRRGATDATGCNMDATEYGREETRASEVQGMQLECNGFDVGRDSLIVILDFDFCRTVNTGERPGSCRPEWLTCIIQKNRSATR